MRSDFRRLVQTSSAHASVAALRLLGSALGFAVTLGVTALLGASNAGILFGTIAWALGLAIGARWGGQDVLLLELPKIREENEAAALLSAVFKTALWRALLITAGVVVVAILAKLSSYETSLNWTFLCALLIATVVLQLFAGAFKGLSRPRLALFAELVMPPLIVGIGALALWAGGFEHRGTAISIFYVAGTIIAAATLFAIGRKILFPSKTPSEAPIGGLARSSNFAVTELSLFLGGFVALLLLPLLMGAEATGVFNLALRMAGIASVIPATVFVVIAPRLVKARESGSSEDWSRTVKEGRVTMLISALAYGLGLWFAGPAILLRVGEEFAAASDALLIMSSLFAAAIALGPSGAILAAIGREDVSRNVAVVSAVIALMIIVPATLIFGLLGAAGATGAVFLGQRLALFMASLRLRPSHLEL